MNKRDKVFLLNCPCASCSTKNQFECARTNYDELCKRLNNWKMLVEYIEQLEKELDNPPLKFKELHEEMWLWDNKTKKYKQVANIPYIDNETGHDVNFVFFRGHKNVMLFEEGRFYRREVNND